MGLVDMNLMHSTNSDRKTIPEQTHQLRKLPLQLPMFVVTVLGAHI